MSDQNYEIRRLLIKLDHLSPYNTKGLEFLFKEARTLGLNEYPETYPKDGLAELIEDNDEKALEEYENLVSILKAFFRIRLAEEKGGELLSHSEIMERNGITQEDLYSINVDID